MAGRTLDGNPPAGAFTGAEKFALIQNDNDVTAETSQITDLINATAQLESTAQVTGLDDDLAAINAELLQKLNKDFSTLTPKASAALADLLAVNNGERLTAQQILTLIHSNDFKTSRDIAVSSSIALDLDFNNVMRCTNSDPIDIFVFDNGDQDPPDNWTTAVYATDGQVTITTNGDPTVILVPQPNSKLVLQQGDVAFIQKIRESGGNKYWAVWGIGNFLPITGGTLTGALTLAADPVSALQAATKQYVDAQQIYTDVVELTTNYIVLDSDRGKLFYCDSVSNIIIDLPPARSKGFWCDFYRKNTGEVDFISDGDIACDVPTISNQNGVVSVIKVDDAQEWMLKKSDILTGFYLPLSGGTLTGSLTLPSLIASTSVTTPTVEKTGTGATTLTLGAASTGNTSTISISSSAPSNSSTINITATANGSSAATINLGVTGNASSAINANGKFNASNAAITGGTIDNTAIGSTTRSTGKFSTVSVNTPNTNAILDLGDATANTKLALFDDGTAANMYGMGIQADQFRIHLGNNSTNYFSFLNNAAGTTELMRIKATGEITAPLQPAFIANKSADQTSITKGIETDVTFSNEVLDQGADFASPNFTAPVTGLYSFNFFGTFKSLNGATRLYTKLVTSGGYGVEFFRVNPTAIMDGTASECAMGGSARAYLTAGQTAKVVAFADGGTSTYAISGSGGQTATFSGKLEC